MINSSHSRKIWIIAVFFLLTNSIGIAAITGKISGRITDETGESLIGVNVFIEYTNMGAATDHNGHYMIINIQPGQYTVRLMMIGYKNQIIQNVQVSSDHTTYVDAQLELSVIEGESVTVSAVKPIIEMDRTSTQATVSAAQLEVMPVSTVSDVLNLQAGVVDGHFRGGRSNEVAYMIDGIPVNDVYNNNASLLLENDVIQELKVISGTFNAEYGQAQSAIVEMITSEGGSEFAGNISITAGDHYSDNDDIFRNINNHSPDEYNEYSVSVRGPFTSRANFLVNYRSSMDEGFKFGRDFFERTVYIGDIWFSDSSAAIYDNFNNVYDPDNSNPDTSSFIPMDDYHRRSFFGKLSFFLSDKDKISLNFTYQKKTRGVYDHLYQYNPLGNSRVNETSNIGYLIWNRLINPTSFLNISVSNSRKKYHRYLFKDKFDHRYATDSRLREAGNFAFYTGGTDMRYYRRNTDTNFFKFSYTNQINRLWELKTGIELKMHEMHLDSLKLKKNPETAFQVEIAPAHTADNQVYDRDPVETAFYIQGKMETKSLTMNLGLRFDYFDSNGEVLDDLTRPQTSTRSKAKSVTQFSPRFGLAYPISDNGVMHVSYGHFFQIPGFENLYTNPDFVINPEEGTNAVLNDPFGNADLKPQKTVAYEVGLQQQISQFISFEVTAYYKDIRNLLGTEINTVASLETFAGINYGRFINRDYGQVKGFTFMFEKAMSDGFSASIDYTFSVAKGNASDPRSTLIDAKSDPPIESEKQLLPLNWDQKHSLNTQVTLNIGNNAYVTIIGKMGTGMPYSLDESENSVHLANAGRKPMRISFDVLGSRNIQVGKVRMKFTLKVYNLFDRLNEIDVHQDSGRASFTEDILSPGQVQGANTKKEYYTHLDWYSSPRQILIGLSLEL
ncbi:MAG: TonB-dependent receptor [Candidatus Marinimicrobia bacterium]|jgi:outer membrane receptor protein involved in Fe transport|nr:TonB-dependent receptor [Candidatus Neomarinimicrobiota bacterium]MBT4852842.1 TonB-dependent receptor [Candidatus Neomarinimicrobiota bacterium]MBT6217659.1 TonB-dependent receptor [Candidatus Neomarinimicrobiota bacterium]